MDKYSDILINGESVRNLILHKLSEPAVFYDCIKKWPCLQWSLEDWSTKIGTRTLPFRIGNKRLTEVINYVHILNITVIVNEP